MDKAQIIDYVRYLDEIIQNGLPLEKELEYQAIKLKLISRLNQLIQEQVKFYTTSKQKEA